MHRGSLEVSEPIDLCFARVGRVRAKFANVAKSGLRQGRTKLADFGTDNPGVAQCPSGAGQIWPSLDWPEFDKNKPNFHEVGPVLAKAVPMLTKPGRSQPNSAALGKVSAQAWSGHATLDRATFGHRPKSSDVGRRMPIQIRTERQNEKPPKVSGTCVFDLDTSEATWTQIVGGVAPLGYRFEIGEKTACPQALATHELPRDCSELAGKRLREKTRTEL